MKFNKKKFRKEIVAPFKSVGKTAVKGAKAVKAHRDSEPQRLERQINIEAKRLKLDKLKAKRAKLRPKKDPFDFDIGGF